MYSTQDCLQALHDDYNRLEQLMEDCHHKANIHKELQSHYEQRFTDYQEHQKQLDRIIRELCYVNSW
jgi:hypothetical protein